MNDDRTNPEEEELPKRKTAISVAEIGAIATIFGAIATIIVALIARIPPPQTAELQISIDENGEKTYTVHVENVNVADLDSAVNSLKRMLNDLPVDARESPDGIDYLTQYAELASAKVSSTNVSGTDIFINNASMKALETISKQANITLENALMGEGIFSYRYLADAITLLTEQISKITIHIDPDILETTIDKVRIENSVYALTITISDLAEHLNEPLSFSVSVEDFTFSDGRFTDLSLMVVMDEERLGNSFMISMPPIEGDLETQLLINYNGDVAASKYNPFTKLIDGYIQYSGTYIVSFQNPFVDTVYLQGETKQAIQTLFASGITRGISPDSFAPYDPIRRGIAINWIMEAVGKIDNSATVDFKDVRPDSIYYHAVASALKHGIVAGTTDSTFEPQLLMTRSQFLTWVGRVMVFEMHYKEPTDATEYLSQKYNDVEAMRDYEKPYVAIATRAGLISPDQDGNFNGDRVMTRAQAAVVIYRLLKRMW